jgi:hypothetical protein
MEAAEREGIRNRNQPANYRSGPDQGYFHDCSYIINHDADCTSFDPKGAAFSERRLRKHAGEVAYMGPAFSRGRACAST